MNHQMSILQQLGEINRDSLTLRVTPSQIDKQLLTVQSQVSKYHPPLSNTTFSSLEQRRGRRRKRQKEKCSTKRGFSTMKFPYQPIY